MRELKTYEANYLLIAFTNHLQALASLYNAFSTLTSFSLCFNCHIRSSSKASKTARALALSSEFNDLLELVDVAEVVDVVEVDFGLASGTRTRSFASLRYLFKSAACIMGAH